MQPWLETKKKKKHCMMHWTQQSKWLNNSINIRVIRKHHTYKGKWIEEILNNAQHLTTKPKNQLSHYFAAKQKDVLKDALGRQDNYEYRVIVTKMTSSKVTLFRILWLHYPSIYYHQNEKSLISTVTIAWKDPQMQQRTLTIQKQKHKRQNTTWSHSYIQEHKQYSQVVQRD